MWTGWNSERYHEKTSTQRIGHMKLIALPSTKIDVVRGTKIQSQKVSAECGSKFIIITYNLASRLVFSRFFDLPGNLGMLKKNRLEKLVSPVKRSA